jgi:hypothetical protein
MGDTSRAFSNRPPRELPPVGFPAAGLCTGCLVHFRHAGPRVMLRGVPCWGHGSSTQRNGDQPGHRPLARDGGQSLGQRARLFPLHPERDRGGAGLDHLDIRPPYQRQCHEGFSLRQGVDNRRYFVPGGGLRLGVGQCGCLGLRARRTGEAAPVFVRGRSLPGALEKDAPRGPAPAPIFGAHAAVGLTLERVPEDGATADLAQGPQHLREQRTVRFLEDLCQVLHGLCLVHRDSSRTGDAAGETGHRPWAVCPARAGSHAMKNDATLSQPLLL